MPTKRSKKSLQKIKRFPIVPVLAIGFVAVLTLSVSGFAFGASQEQRDSFCASCHTQPETTYYQRSTAGSPVDLASDHTPKNVNCIDCHSGSGIVGRVGAEMLGARNAALWYSHTAVQPAKLSVPIADDNCVKCHAQVLSTSSMDNHFHYFLSRWQAADPNAAKCATCHTGHSTDVVANQAFINAANVSNECQACHQVLGGGG
ncbi:MAG TPA: NapC/NirT family cytochrome c [Anaerolineaceae bacterium]